MRHQHRLSWYRPLALYRSLILRPRIIAAGAAGALSLLALPAALSSSLRWALAWDIGGAVYLALACELMARTTPERIRSHAEQLDEGRFTILIIILLAIASSFAAIIGMLGEARDAARATKLIVFAVAAVTITISWTITQLLFAIHYAHEHYAETITPGSLGALEFPGDDLPDYWDFFYFSTSIGATSQTSDVAIRSRIIRRLVTVHAIVSFFFNAAVLALAINLAAGLAG